MPPADGRRRRPTFAPQIPGISDADDYKKLQLALGWFGIEASLQNGLWEVLIGALFLGNIAFDGSEDEPAQVTAQCEADLSTAERLLGMTGLRAPLVEKEISAGGVDRMTL